MAGTQATRSGAYTGSELRAFRRELRALALTARDYPMEYALGACELLFESRDDIEIIVDNLDESIAALQDVA
jgi:hypothetical protein